MTEGGDIDKLGRGHIWEEEIPGCIHQNHVFAVRSNTEKVSPRYLALVARSLYGKQYFLSRAKRTSNLASINSSQIKNFPVPLPSLQIQMGLVRRSKSLYSNSSEVKAHIVGTRALQKSLINQIF
jgi:type I restriction enzyme S subunit